MKSFNKNVEECIKIYSNKVDLVNIIKKKHLDPTIIIFFHKKKVRQVFYKP